MDKRMQNHSYTKPNKKFRCIMGPNNRSNGSHVSSSKCWITQTRHNAKSSLVLWSCGTGSTHFTQSIEISVKLKFRWTNHYPKHKNFDSIPTKPEKSRWLLRVWWCGINENRSNNIHCHISRCSSIWRLSHRKSLIVQERSPLTEIWACGNATGC